ncbi:hypothetical protein BH09ACT1_BH09ACT1_01510 [soil metagenome]
MPDEKTPAEKTPAEIELEDSIRSIRGVGENVAGTGADETDADARDDDTGSAPAEPQSR